MITTYDIIAHNLRVLRAVKQMTQEALSVASGVSRNTINRIENCDYKSVTVELLIKLAAALQTDVSYFFDHEV